ncbi:MAG: hypothetical protein IPK58_22505 [Acidobacteria bacterium]|nr:hypothetical protein [Acidobacteriota bacterium]
MTFKTASSILSGQIPDSRFQEQFPDSKKNSRFRDFKIPESGFRIREL